MLKIWCDTFTVSYQFVYKFQACAFRTRYGRVGPDRAGPIDHVYRQIKCKIIKKTSQGASDGRYHALFVFWSTVYDVSRAFRIYGSGLEPLPPPFPWNVLLLWYSLQLYYMYLDFMHRHFVGTHPLSNFNLRLDFCNLILQLNIHKIRLTKIIWRNLKCRVSYTLMLTSDT